MNNKSLFVFLAVVVFGGASMDAFSACSSYYSNYDTHYTKGSTKCSTTAIGVAVEESRNGKSAEEYANYYKSHSDATCTTVAGTRPFTCEYVSYESRNGCGYYSYKCKEMDSKAILAAKAIENNLKEKAKKEEAAKVEKAKKEELDKTTKILITRTKILNLISKAKECQLKADNAALQSSTSGIFPKTYHWLAKHYKEFSGIICSGYHLEGPDQEKNHLLQSLFWNTKSPLPELPIEALEDTLYLCANSRYVKSLLKECEDIALAEEGKSDSPEISNQGRKNDQKNNRQEDARTSRSNSANQR